VFEHLLGDYKVVALRQCAGANIVLRQIDAPVTTKGEKPAPTLPRDLKDLQRFRRKTFDEAERLSVHNDTTPLLVAVTQDFVEHIANRLPRLWATAEPVAQETPKRVAYHRIALFPDPLSAMLAASDDPDHQVKSS
jgi:hypothetical protein